MSYVIMCILFVGLALYGQVLSNAQIRDNQALNEFNSDTRNRIIEIGKSVADALRSNKLSVNKAIQLLTTKQANAMSTYLYNNPVISAKLSTLLKDNDEINRLSLDQSNIENEINDLLNQLNNMGYESSVKHRNALGVEDKSYYEAKVSDRNDKIKEIEDKLANAQERYDNLSKQADKISSKGADTHNYTKANMSDIVARSQNILGGLKN